MSWPFAGDGATVRARRVALAYREALYAADPQACGVLDHRMTTWGQTWAVPRRLRFGLDDLVTAAEAADLANVGLAQVRHWRLAGQLPGIADGRSFRYRVRDVLAMSTSARTRGDHGG